VAQDEESHLQSGGRQAGAVRAGGELSVEIRVSVREARLKPEFAAEYPGMPADMWMPAIELAPFLLQRARVRRQEGRYTRTFDPTHFDFRGGDPRPRPRISRTRSTDPKA
jgi:hypothetical protein